MVALRRDDPVAVENLASGQLLDLGNGVQHTACHILERRFHRRRSFAAVGLAICVADLFDKNGLSRGTAAIGSDDHVDAAFALQCCSTAKGGSLVAKDTMNARRH